MSATYAAPLYTPKFRAFNAAGAPLAGGLVNVYAAGTTSRLSSYPTYTDAINGTNANANPVVLDANGEANIFLPNIFGGGLYKVVLTDSTSVVQWTEDNFNPAGQYLDPRSCLSVIKSGTQAGTGIAAKITGWTVEVDALTEWSAANNRWTATYAGNYLVLMSASAVDSVASQFPAVQIRKNGTSVASSGILTGPTTASACFGHVQHILTLSAADYIEMYGLGNATTTWQAGSGTTISIARLP